MFVEAVVKAITVAIVIAGALIASFYFAYLLIVLLVLGGVGVIAYLFFSKAEKVDREDFPD